MFIVKNCKEKGIIALKLKKSRFFLIVKIMETMYISQTVNE
jgi:hypothetical protein